MQFVKRVFSTVDAMMMAIQLKALLLPEFAKALRDSNMKHLQMIEFGVLGSTKITRLETKNIGDKIYWVSA